MSKNLHKDIENWAVLLGGGVSLLVIFNIVLMVVVCLLMSSCGSASKVERMKERQMKAVIGMVEMPGQAGHDGRGDNAVRDTTLLTSDEGPIIMNAVRDEDGNMVVTDVLEAASVMDR